MPTIYLLRHCDYANPLQILPGRLPVVLSDKGKQQAKKLADFFADKKIHTIYPSEVERCKETSTLVANGKIPIEFDTRLLETFSAYQGYWNENRDGDRYHFYSHRDELGGENLSDLKKRVGSFWDEVAKNATGNIIICSHGDPLQVLYAHIHELPLVDEHELEANIPGWLQKGQFIEVLLEEGKVVETKAPTWP